MRLFLAVISVLYALDVVKHSPLVQMTSAVIFIWTHAWFLAVISVLYALVVVRHSPSVQITSAVIFIWTCARFYTVELLSPPGSAVISLVIALSLLVFVRAHLLKKKKKKNCVRACVLFFIGALVCLRACVC